MDVRSPSIQSQIAEWLKNGYGNEQISEELFKRGFEDRHLPEMLKEINRLRNAQKTSSGLILILIGAVVCLLSCIVTMTSSYSHNNFAFILYGLTTIGILVVFAGLMKIFN